MAHPHPVIHGFVLMNSHRHALGKTGYEPSYEDRA
jgi:hypothetical protein